MVAGLTKKFIPVMMTIEQAGISITTDTIKSKLMDMKPKYSDLIKA